MMKIVNTDSLSTVELKALQYDLIVQVEKINQTIGVVHAEIQKRKSQPALPLEVPVAKKKKDRILPVAPLEQKRQKLASKKK